MLARRKEQSATCCRESTNGMQVPCKLGGLKAPIAVLGYHMDMPCKRDISGDDLVEIIEKKEFVGVDLVDQGILERWEYNENGNPWLYQHRIGHKYTQEQEKQWGDLTLLQLSEKEAKFMSMFQLIALESVWKALEKSGIPTSLLHKTKTGVFVAGYQMFGGFESYPDETSLRGGLTSGLSDRIAYFLGTHGPSVTLETACSSSLVAMTIAANSIRNGSCDVAILACTNIFNSEYELALQATGVVSAKGECRPFDADASGTVRCEGFGCMILCSMEWARDNNYCGTIKSLLLNATMGSAGADPMAKQGSGRVYESPNAHGMAEMIKLCHQQIDLPLDEIAYVEAHATGTPVGDLVELNALKEVYQRSHSLDENPLRVGSIKGNIGHAEIAAGLFSTIKVIEMLRRRKFLPTGGFSISPRQDFDWDESNIALCLESSPFPTDKCIHMGVNSFGVGGSYAHAILCEYQGESTILDSEASFIASEEKEAKKSLQMPLIFPISAASVQHLDTYESQIAQYLCENPGKLSLLDICGCFATNRTRLSVSRHYLVHSMEQLIEKLTMKPKSRVCEDTGLRGIAFVFTGQGSQWVSMGSKLSMFKVYRDALAQFDAKYKKLSGWSPLAMLSSLEEDRLADTMYAQPLTFMVQMGLVELLKYFGIHPKVVLGHSAGEIAALYCSGHLSLEDAVKVIFQRSYYQQTLSGNGRMLAVQTNKDGAKKVLKMFATTAAGCQIACNNSHNSVVIAGPTNELKVLREYFTSLGVRNTLLKGNTAFHSHLMDPILEYVESRLSFLNDKSRKKGYIPFVSTVTARRLTRITPEYFVHNIRQPVQFLEAVGHMMIQYEPDVIVEIGPHKTLAPLLLECIDNEHDVKVMTSLCKGQDDVQSFWQLILGLLDANISVDLSPLYTDLGYKFSNAADKHVPGHPFFNPKYHEKSWVVQRKKLLEGKWDVGPAAGTMESQNNSLVTVVEINRATCPSMTDHVMGGQVLLPGMYFVEAAIEAWAFQHKNYSLVMSEVTFQDMCPVPDRLKNQQPRKLFVKQSSEETNGMTNFTIESKPLRDSDVTVHCTGAMASFSCPEALDGTKYMTGRMGFKEKHSDTRDIGPQGIKWLLESHTDVYSKKQVYDMINMEGVTEYGQSFQVIEEVRMNYKRSSLVASLEYDHSDWNRKGGVYGIQLLDGILQLGFLNPHADSGVVMYAGGFDLGIFARRPVSNPCLVHVKFTEEKDGEQQVRYGKTLISGDALLYDANGDLLCHLIGIKCIIGRKVSRTFDSIQVWHPMTSKYDEMLEKTDVSTSRTENEHVQVATNGTNALASTILRLIAKRGDLTRAKSVYLRILELWEDSAHLPKVFESLVRAEDEIVTSNPKLLVEIFIATHNRDVLQKSFHIPMKQKKWLRVRLVLLPSAKDVLNKMCFDVIAAWYDGKFRDTGWTGPLELIQGIGKFGYEGCVLLHDFQLDPSCSKYVSQRCEHGGEFFSCRLQRDIILRDDVNGKDVLVLCHDEGTCLQFSAALLSLTSDFKTKLNIRTASLTGKDDQEISDIVEDFTSKDSDREKHVVSLDGLYDESKYSEETFAQVAKVVHFLGAKKRKAYMWVISCNVFSNPIKIDHCSLFAIVNGINTEFVSILAKFVEIGVPNPREALEALAVLFLRNPGPSQFMIDDYGDVYQSIVLPIEKGCILGRRSVSAKDPDFYYRCGLATSDQTGMVEYDFFAYPVTAPSKGEVLIEVHTASLNFRDVMLTLNALPRSSFEDSFYGSNLGMECSGVVTAVGEGVSHVAIGDPVSVVEAGTFSSKLVVPASRVVSLKGYNITLEQAAAVPSVYSTAYHSLVQLCSLKKGERVLIQAAAGGVGHAAVSICSYVGADIYVTASKSKQEYCHNVLGVSKSHIFDSRNVSWFDDLMQATGDEGVDVVLNCLAGEHQRLGLECLRPGGRFCEIGKMDIFNNEKLFLFAFRKNIRLLAIDMDRMLLDSQHLVQDVRSIIFEHLSNGDFKCLPFTAFTMDKIGDAIEYMKSGSHIGKVILTNLAGDQPVTIPSRGSLTFDAVSYVLILGGAGGFGSRMIRWAFQKGARKFITTVSADSTRVTKMYSDLIESGAIFEVIEADLTNIDDLAKIERHATEKRRDGQIRTMIHCAGIYEPFYFDEILNKSNVLGRQGDIKIRSAIFLHNLSLKLKESIQYFILVGSNSSELTQPFMASYAATNAMLGGVARERQALGLPVTILHMSSIKDVGMVSKDEVTLDYQKRFRMEFIPSTRAIKAIEKMLCDNVPSMVQAFYVSRHLMNQIGAAWNGAHTTPSVDSLLIYGEDSKKSSGGNMRATYDQALERVTWLLQDILGIEGEIPPTLSLSMMGIDSLGILEFRQHLQDEFDYTIDRTAFAMTIGDLAKEIHNRLKELAAHDDEETDDDSNENNNETEEEKTVHIEQEAVLRRNYLLRNPKGYFFAIPGLDLNGLYFLDWKSDEIQIIVVDLKTLHGNPQAIAKVIASEIKRLGYLKDLKKPLSILGYSFGCFIGLELCKELSKNYSCIPLAFFPVAYAAPHSCRSKLQRIPSHSIRRKIIYAWFRRQISREYGDLDPEDQQLHHAYLQKPTLPAIFRFEEAAQGYYRQVWKDLKNSKKPYIGGDIPIHYFFATKDEIGNPKGQDPRNHGWSKYTSGPCYTYSWHAMHSLIVDPIVGNLFQEHVMDIVHDIFESHSMDSG